MINHKISSLKMLWASAQPGRASEGRGREELILANLSLNKKRKGDPRSSLRLALRRSLLEQSDLKVGDRVDVAIDPTSRTLLIAKKEHGPCKITALSTSSPRVLLSITQREGWKLKSEAVSTSACTEVEADKENGLIAAVLPAHLFT